MISFATQRAATGTPALTILRIAVAAAYPGCVCQARRRNCRTERRAESVAIQERMPPSPTERWRFCAVGFKAWGDSSRRGRDHARRAVIADGDSALTDGDCPRMDGDCARMDGGCARTDGDCAPFDGVCALLDGNCAPTDGVCAPLDGVCALTDGVCAPSDGVCA